MIYLCRTHFCPVLHMQHWRGEVVYFSGKTKQPRAVPACMCVHTCVRVHHTCANASAGTQKLRCGPQSRREEGEVIVRFRVCCWLVTALTWEETHLRCLWKPFSPFLPSVLGSLGEKYASSSPARTLLQRKGRALTPGELWEGAGEWGWEEQRAERAGWGGTEKTAETSGWQDPRPFTRLYLCYFFYSLEVVFFKMVCYV